MARTRRCRTPSKCEGQEFAIPRLYIFGLVIQDTLSPLGKLILLKGDEVVAQVLSDIDPKPLNQFLETHMSKTPIYHFGPTDISIPDPPR